VAKHATAHIYERNGNDRAGRKFEGSNVGIRTIVEHRRAGAGGHMGEDRARARLLRMMSGRS
jgi:hypothetical protein